MEDAQGFLGHPEVGFFSMLLIGVLAGWVAERVIQSDHSIFTNILVGIAGSFVGGLLASILNIQVFGYSYFGGRNHRRHLDSVYMASSTQSEMTRGAEMAASARLMGIKLARALKRGEVTCAWINCRAATR
ncbi:MAG: GlsB/YeaQ/YmgE family stress response membrane protein [Tardiphaga sp.]